MRITIIGGGNIGTLLAGEMAYKGHSVTVCTSKPYKWNNIIDVLDDRTNVLMSGKINSVTDDLGKAVENAEIIWVTLPAHMFIEFGKKLARYITPGQVVGVIPGSGGAEFAFRSVIDKGAVLFGLQRVHSIARIEKYGKSVHMLGRKSKLEIGSVPPEKSLEISRIINTLMDIPCEALPNYLCVTLTPSNQILHTTRLYTMFRDYKQGIFYPRNFLFYEEWTMEASEMLIACDIELQAICETIPINLEKVVSLREYYESQTADAMTQKIRGIKAFKSLTSPMVLCESGWKPDLSSRYFTSDFPYGLKIIKDLAGIFGVVSPNINAVWNWYKDFDRVHAENAFLLNMRKNNLLKMYK